MSSHSAREPPSCACAALPSYPAPLIVCVDRPIRAPCTTGSRRTRRPRLRRPSLITYELGQKHREPIFCAARRTRLARAVAARRRAPARSCCRCSSGRCWRRRCGRGGATSRCWLVQLGELGAWAAVSGAPEQCWAGGPALARRLSEKTNVSSRRGAARGTSAHKQTRRCGASIGPQGTPRVPRGEPKCRWSQVKPF